MTCKKVCVLEWEGAPSLGLGHSLFRSGFRFHFWGFWVCALLFAVPHTILLIFFPLMALSRGHTTASIACRSDFRVFRYSPAFTNFTIIVALFLLRQLACIFFTRYGEALLI